MLNEFFSIRDSMKLGPAFKNPSQRKALKEKLLILKDKILSHGEALFRLKMDERFDNIVQFFVEKRPVLDLIELVENFAK